MNLDKFFSVALAIVVVAGITTVVVNANSANDIKALGTAFSGSLNAAMGKG